MQPDQLRRDRDGYLLANGQGVRLPAAADPLGRAEYLAVAQVGGAGKDGRNQSIFLAAALPTSAFEKGLAHLVSVPSPVLRRTCCPTIRLLLALCMMSSGTNAAAEASPLPGI